MSPFVSIDRSVARNAMASIEKTLDQMKDKGYLLTSGEHDDR